MSKEKLDSKRKEESNFANAPTSKKIGFFSAMLVVIGSSVGAGIFFKAGNVLDNSQGSIVFAMFCWVLAGFAVIAMALALIEIASARNDNLSVIGWCQTFNSRFTYKACKNFMAYVYLPLTYFFMPLYTIMSIQDGISSLIPNYNGFGTSADWAIMMVFAILISAYFIIVNGISSKMGNIHNWIITSVKFLPLVFAAVLGFVILGMNGQIANTGYDAGFNPSIPTDYSQNSQEYVAYNSNNFSSIYNFANLTPGFGMFIAIGSIFFAYDGFYVTAGIQTEMKEPKKTPYAILFGLIAVTVIYLIIALSMSLGSEDGSPFGFEDFLVAHGVVGLYAAFQILIGVGVLGIINGYSLWSTRFVEDLIRANELPFSTKLVGKIKENRAYVGLTYNLVVSLPIVLIFCIIGGLAYVNSSGYAEYYGSRVAELYSFGDLMATWTSVMAFTFILLSIVGAMKNRKTNHIKVEKSKYFYPMAIASVITMSLPIFMTFFGPIADMFMLFWIPQHDTVETIDGVSVTVISYVSDILVPRIMSVVVLLLFMGLMIVPTIIEDYKLKKQYGSIEKGEIAKIEKMAKATGLTLKEKLIESIQVQKRNILNEEEKAILGVNSMDELNQ